MRVNARAPRSADLDHLRGNPWSWPVFEAALKVAVIYPLFLALTAWCFYGAAEIGGQMIFPDEAPMWLRRVIFSVIAAVIVLRILVIETLRGFFEKFSALLLIAVAVSFTGISVLGFALKFAVISLFFSHIFASRHLYKDSQLPLQVHSHSQANSRSHS